MKRKAVIKCWRLGRVVNEIEFETIESDKVSGKGCCIPEGTYTLMPYASPKFGRVVPLLEGVQGRTYIEIHAAGKPEDVRGCIGTTRAREKRITEMVQNPEYEKVTVTVMGD